MSDSRAALRVPEEVYFRELDGESVLLHGGSGLYFGLDETGTRMWQRLTEEGSFDGALRRLLDDFEVDETTLRRDLEELLGRLLEKGLLVTA